MRDLWLELRRLGMAALLSTGLLSAYVGLLVGLEALIGPSPLLTSGIVAEPAPVTALYRVSPDCAVQNGPHACPLRLVQREGPEAVHLRGDDGQIVTVAAQPSTHPSLPDEDPRDDYLLVAIHPGDRVSAVLHGEQALLSRQTAEELRSARWDNGLSGFALGQLGGALCLGLRGLLRRLGVQPPPRPAGWYERPLFGPALPLEVNRAILLAVAIAVGALFALSVPVSVYSILHPPPVVASGVVTDPGDAQGVVAEALWGEEEKRTVLEESRSSGPLHLRTSDGQIVEIEVAPPSSLPPDEDARPDHRLYRIRSGDTVTVLDREGQLVAERGTPQDAAARSRSDGLAMLLVMPLLLVILGGGLALHWNYGIPWSPMTSNLARMGSGGADER